jgi:hypothetical protein
VLGDGIALALRALPRLDAVNDDQSVALQPGQGGIDLPEGQRSVLAEAGVVRSFQLVAVAGSWLQ